MKKAKRIYVYYVTFYKEQFLNNPRFDDVEYEIEDGVLKIKVNKVIICYPLENIRRFEIEEY